MNGAAARAACPGLSALGMAVRQGGTETAQGKLECIGTVEQWDGIGLKLLLPRTWPNGALRDPMMTVVRLVRAKQPATHTTTIKCLVQNLEATPSNKTPGTESYVTPPPTGSA